MRLDLVVQGPGVDALLSDTKSGLRRAADAGMARTLQAVKPIARAAIANALGPRAAKLYGFETYRDGDQPTVGYFHSRWWHGRQDVLYGFYTGATVRPRQATFLAVPTAAAIEGAYGLRGGVGSSDLAGVSYAAGQVPKQLFFFGRRDSLGRFRGGADWEGKRRIRPGLLEQQMGVKLRLVPAGHGRRYAMLVVDNARVGPSGRLQRGQTKRGRVTVVAFLLLPQTHVPALIDFDPVVTQAGGLLQQNVLDAIQTGVGAGGVPQFEVPAA